MKFKLPYSVIVFLLPTLTGAPCIAAPGWGSAPLQIESIIPTDGDFQVIVSGNDNPVGCSSPTWLKLKFTNPGFTSISATIITAFSQSKKIRAWQNSCDTDGGVVINAVWVDR